jgi:DNA-binding response OmpR family regulator
MVEDEPRLREMLLRAMREMGLEPEGVGSAEAAVRVMEQRPAPVMIIDLNLPAAGGMDLLNTLRQRWPQTQAIILTGFGDLEAARQAIRLDVVDFLTKPCSLGDLEIALGRAFRRHREQSTPGPKPFVNIDPDGENDVPAQEDQETAVPPKLNFPPLESSRPAPQGQSSRGSAGIGDQRSQALLPPGTISTGKSRSLMHPKARRAGRMNDILASLAR